MKRILLVDGQKELRDFLSKFFFLSRYEVETAEDTEAAMALIRMRPYDLVILDSKMPNTDGLFLIKRLKMCYPSLPIMIMSDSCVGEPFFREAGADGFLTKPIDLSSLKILVEELLNSKP